MLKFLRCFFMGHDLKFISSHYKRFFADGEAVRPYTDYTDLAFICKKCGKIINQRSKAHVIESELGRLEE